MQCFIYGIVKDDVYVNDPDAAIDQYYYHKYDDDGNYYGRYYSERQDLVNRVKEGTQAYTYPHGHIGAQCEVKVSPYGVEYLKSIPVGNPENNISALPEM